VLAVSDPQHDLNDPVLGAVHVTTRQAEGTSIITVAGEIDMVTAPTVHDAVRVALEDPSTGACIVDLTEVAFLGSAGLTALMQATEHARHRREPLRIVVDGNQLVIRPIEVTGLDHLLALYHSVEEALAAGDHPTSQ
jgi:anti-sigma B factor antagonist